MKLLLVILITSLCVGHVFCQPVLVKNEKHQLRLKGKLMNGELDKKNQLDSVAINVFNETDSLLGTFYSDKKGKCEIRIALNEHYKIAFERKGFMSKTIMVNTLMPPEKKAVYIFPFDMELFPYNKSLENNFNSTPVARLIYHRDKEQFGYEAEAPHRIKD